MLTKPHVRGESKKYVMHFMLIVEQFPANSSISSTSKVFKEDFCFVHDDGKIFA